MEFRRKRVYQNCGFQLVHGVALEGLVSVSNTRRHQVRSVFCICSGIYTQSLQSLRYPGERCGACLAVKGQGVIKCTLALLGQASTGV